MNTQEKEYFRQLIQKKKHDLFTQLGYLQSTYEHATAAIARSVNTDDHATDTLEREMAFDLAHRERRYLYHLNEALERIENGTYGECLTCGEKIGKPRLEAVPHATQCIACKSKEEKRKKGL